MLNIETVLSPNCQQIDFPQPKKKKIFKRKKIGEQREEEQESYQPEFHEAKKIGIALGDDRQAKGGWSLEEIKIYLAFLIEHREDFECETARRKKKVFNQLSKILIKRTPDQCRSHHQKLQVRCENNFDKIIDYVQRKIEVKISRIKEQISITGHQQFKVHHSRRTTISSEKYDQESPGFVIYLNELAVW